MALPTCLLILVLPGSALRRRIARAGARLGFALAGLFPKIEGLPAFDRLPSAVVVANHSSYTDALLLTAVLPARFRFVAKQELLRNRLLAVMLRRLDCAFVERFDPARGMEDTTMLEQMVQAGASLVYFPEGTFRREPRLLPFRLGAFLCAARAQVPVVPLALTGTRSLLRDGRWWPSRTRLAVLGGAVATPAGMDWQSLLRLRDTARNEILSRIQEPDVSQ